MALLEKAMLVEFLVVASALYVGFNIGANDAANCVGACVGGGALGVRSAVVAAAIFCFVGGLLGTNVTRTIANDVLPSEDVTPSLAATCLLVSGGLVALATMLGLPVSTSHAVVLGLVGGGLAMGSAIRTNNVLQIVGAWVLLPLAMIVLSFVLVKSLNAGLSKIMSLVRLEIALKYMLIGSSFYASFALGANHAGLAGGMLEGVDILGRFCATLVGSASLSLGVLLLSGRVIRTIGQGIVPLGPLSAFSMQVSAAVGMTVCSLLGIPVSSSQAIVASALGIGMARGAGTVNRSQISKIFAFWAIVPLGTMIVSYLIMKLLG